MYELYAQTTHSDDYSYKLVQLPADLLEYVKQQDAELTIKAPSTVNNHMVLCTKNTTYKLRQMNHSNTVLLMNDLSVNKLEKSVKPTFEGVGQVTSNSLVSMATLSYEYEPTITKGYIETERLSVYNGTNTPIPEDQQITIQTLLEESPISTVQFYKEWYNKGGCEINGHAVILSRQLLTELISTLLTILISEGIDYNESLGLDQVTSFLIKHDSSITSEIVNTVIQKFGVLDDSNSFKLDHEIISKWFGIQTLFQTSFNLISCDDFLVAWKTSLPTFYNVPIDLIQLRGNFCRPTNDKIQHLNPSTLSTTDLGMRIKELFAIAKNWDYDEFMPYIQSYIPIGKKPESIVLKYAKKKRVGKKYIVCQR
ncbi:sister chromatid cohesion protein Dcc1p [[Candida] anglica]|uniref:Sister chromatid cohesion protein Dcc1p n=1 Tax=[Candida] anglica TaxID=148631 RepID=A0ABP0EHN3_9ASCO